MEGDSMSKKEVITALCIREEHQNPKNISELKEIFNGVWPFPENGWSFSFTDKRVQTAFHHPELGCLGIINVARSRNMERVIQDICDLCKNTDMSHRYDDWKWLTPEKKEIRRNAYQKGMNDLVYMLKESYLEVAEHSLNPLNQRVYGVEKDIEQFLEQEKEGNFSKEYERG